MWLYSGILFRLAPLVCGLVLVATGCDRTPPHIEWSLPFPCQPLLESTDVAWISSLATREDRSQLYREVDKCGYGMEQVRSLAFCRLGALGTQESLAAFRAAENEFRQRRLPSAMALVDHWLSPGWVGAETSRQTLATFRTGDGKSGVLLQSILLGGMDFFVMTRVGSDKEDIWTRPRLIPHPVKGIVDTAKVSALAGDEYLIEYLCKDMGFKTPPPRDSFRFKWEDVVRDTDGDGWSDAEELRLGLAPTNPDTDDDEIPDGIDPCPLYHQPASDAADEEVQMLQRALFVAVELMGSRVMLLANTRSNRRIHLSCYRGPLLYQPRTGWPPAIQTKYAWDIHWDLDHKRADLAEVYVSLKFGDVTVVLRKIRGEWFPVGLKGFKVP